MNCPRCKTPLGNVTNPDQIITCSGCGVRLVTRPSRAKQTPPAAATAPPAAAATGPPPATATAPPAATAKAPPPAAATPPPPAISTAAPATATPPPATSTPPPPAAPASPPAAGAPASVAETLQALVREVNALRQGQQRMLALLESRAGSAGDDDGEEDEQAPPALDPIRAHSRKSVLLIDDDPETREAAVAELKQADVPVRVFADGNSAISGIAEQKPDVIVLELGLDGQMAGRDVINMIKATMEWVDIPIVLWTRVGVSNQKEARQIHGADEIVPKTAGASALAARIINVFRRG